MRIIVVGLLTLACGGGSATFGTGHGKTAAMHAEDARAGKTVAGAPVAPGVVAEGIDKHKLQTDEFKQHERGVLDILIVIDNSGSMAGEQNLLASNLPALLQHIEGSDWQIAVISTSLNECLSERLTKLTPDYPSKYSTLINVGTRGGGEHHFYKAIQGLKGECSGSHHAWLRKDSTIAVLVVTDECNKCRSYTTNCIEGPASAVPCKSSDLADHLDSIRPLGNARVYGLLPPEQDAEWKMQVVADPDVNSLFAARGDVNAANYDTTLKKISKNVQGVLEDVFVLSQVPAVVAKVLVNDKALTASQYEVAAADKLLKFNRGYLPPDNAQIKIVYHYLSD